MLAELLDLQLAPDRIEPHGARLRGPLPVPPQAGLRAVPARVRLRHGFTELSVRADEFAAPPPGITRAYVVENEITYLAFPLPADAIVIFGGGYAVDVLESLAWLADLDLVYWGDIDTHGFAILNRLRHRVPARPLHAHGPRHPARPPRPVGDRAHPHVRRPGPPEPRRAGPLPRPGDASFGPAVRLEQERISFAAIEQALSAPAIAAPMP